MPNYGNQSWQPPTGTFVNYSPQMNTGGNWMNTQPTLPVNQSRVMSIAPASSRENAQQFPVAVNTDLYLVNLNEMKLYLKNNPTNPAEMREFDIVEVVKQAQPTDTVTRAEFDEMKSMMAQMMGMLQGNQNEQRSQKNYNGKRGGRNDRSDGNATDHG